MSWEETTNMTQAKWMGEFVNCSIESFLQYPDEPTQNPMGRIIKKVVMH